MLQNWQPRIRLDPGLAAVLALAALAAWPFLTRASLPTQTDAELHIFRTFEILDAWRAGVPYLRWAPDLFYGYGYPVFHYYAPLTYYLAALYGAVFGGAAAGIKAVLVASAFLGALGMYLFVRDRWGGLAGIVAAAAYVFSPYMVYIDPHARGAVPETFAISLAPLMLWAFARLRRTASPGGAALSGLLLAALLLSHNLMSFVFFGLLLAWLAWDLVFGQALFGGWAVPARLSPTAEGALPQSQDRRRVALALGAAVALGLGLSACMWLPAALERGAVQFQNVAGGTYFDFRQYFIGLRELFAPALVPDLGASELRFNYSLGLAQWVLAALGMLTVFPARLRRLSVMFFALAAVALVYLMLPASLSVWDAFPPMAFLQFPTRLLGPTAVVLGVLAGAGLGWAQLLHQIPGTGGWLRRLASPAALAAVAVAGCVLGAMPLMYPAPWKDFGPVTALRLLETELSGRHLGTTSANDFLPVGVQVVPGPQDSLVQSYYAGQVDKINRRTLPAGTTVEILEHGPELDRFLVTGDTDFILRPYTFYWEGWAAYVDGQRVPIEVAQPDGWITLWVPAGTHVVRLQLENTPARWWGWALSGLALAGLAALTFWRARASVPLPAPEGLPWRQALLFGALALAGMGLRLSADQLGGWRVWSTGTEVRVAQVSQVTLLERGLALLAYDLPFRRARPGDALPVTLYWKKLSPLDQDLRVFVHLVGPDGQVRAQSDKWNPADYPTHLWPLDRYVRDEHTLRLPADAPPGEYTLFVGLWDGASGERMRVLDSADRLTERDGILLALRLQVEP